tara:strand:- start:6044 stop:6568 length:525 start_codon:yes stop_codon:yes gene_type:complete
MVKYVILSLLLWTIPLYAEIKNEGVVVQLERAPGCRPGSCGFESHRPRGSIVINGLSWHDSNIGFNEKNYGLGLEKDLNKKVFIYGGFFKDSFNATAKYIGTGYRILSKGDISFNGIVGITHKNINWNEDRVLPYILPSVSFYNFNLVVLPEGEYKDYKWPTTLFLQYKLNINN